MKFRVKVILAIIFIGLRGTIAQADNPASAADPAAAVEAEQALLDYKIRFCLNVPTYGVTPQSGAMELPMFCYLEDGSEVALDLEPLILSRLSYTVQAAAGSIFRVYENHADGSRIVLGATELPERGGDYILVLSPELEERSRLVLVEASETALPAGGLLVHNASQGALQLTLNDVVSELEAAAQSLYRVDTNDNPVSLMFSSQVRGQWRIGYSTMINIGANNRGILIASKPKETSKKVSVVPLIF